MGTPDGMASDGVDSRRPLSIGSVAARMGTLAAAVLLTMALLEGVARWLPLWPDPISGFDPELGYAHVPNARGWWVNIVHPLELRAYVEISSQGLRDRDFALEKPPGHTRIMILGDSFVDALEVALADSHAKQLERLFGNAGKPVEVINGGHYGWGTDQELLFYRLRGARFHPDIVVLGFCPNDFQNNMKDFSLGPKPYFELDASGTLALRNFPVPEQAGERSGMTLLKPLKGWLYDHSKLYRFTGFQLRTRVVPAVRALLGAPTAAADPAHAKSGRAAGESASPAGAGPDQRRQELTAALLAELRREVERTNAEFVLVILPTMDVASPRWRTIRSYEWIAEICERGAFDCVDLMVPFRALHRADPERAYFFPNDGHPTPLGHREIARLLFEALAERVR